MRAARAPPTPKSAKRPISASDSSNGGAARRKPTLVHTAPKAA
jgi:hypothetical protein